MNNINGGDVRFMNIAKALGIIAIVIGHSGSPLQKYVYLYHLSLFYFISGYFFRDEYVQAPLTLIKKRVKTLYLPYISYQIPFLLLHNIFLQIGIYSYSYTYIYTRSDFFENAIKIMAFSSDELLTSLLWFLCSLFFVNILYCIIRLVGTYIRERERFSRSLLYFSYSHSASAPGIKITITS